jgi:hypothetical protein
MLVLLPSSKHGEPRGHVIFVVYERVALTSKDSVNWLVGA